MRPVLHAIDVTMLDRIEMDVVNMANEVALVSQGMFPVAPLPNTPLTFGNTACRKTFATRQPS